MDLFIIVGAVGAVGLVGVAIAISWPLYIKPMLRRRYERKHHRSKITGRQGERAENE